MKVFKVDLTPKEGLLKLEHCLFEHHRATDNACVATADTEQLVRLIQLNITAVTRLASAAVAGFVLDAALVGLDQGELITIPSLPDEGEWQAFVRARHVMAPNLSRSSAAQRYKN